MPLFVGHFCVFVVVLCEVCTAEYQRIQTSLRNENNIHTNIEDYKPLSENIRRKRGWPSMLKNGLANAFNGAKRYQATSKTEFYWKPGNIDTAKQDFFAFLPRGVRKPRGRLLWQHGEVLFGSADNIQLRLYEKGNKSNPFPLLEITHIGKRAGRKIDKIYYKDSGKDV